MKSTQLIERYQSDQRILSLAEVLKVGGASRTHLVGLTGSASAIVAASVFRQTRGSHVFILQDKETAAYFSNDLENILGEVGEAFHKKEVLFYPTSYKRPC